MTLKREHQLSLLISLLKTEFVGYWLLHHMKPHISPTNLSFSSEWTSFGELFTHMVISGYPALPGLTHNAQLLVDIQKASKAMARDVLECKQNSVNIL